MTEKNKIFDKYLSSIFVTENTFSKKEYDEHFEFYNINYGKFLPENKNANILDIGCGAGHFLYFLKKKGYKNILGIDISPEQVAFCKEKNISEEIELADAFEFLKNKINYYDAIISNDVIEHIPKDKIIDFLILINNALKSKGLFFARTPNLGHPLAIYSRYKDFTHEIGFTDKSLYQVLWVAGL